jgi:hypothetical protein
MLAHDGNRSMLLQQPGRMGPLKEAAVNLAVWL